MFLPHSSVAHIHIYGVILWFLLASLLLLLFLFRPISILEYKWTEYIKIRFATCIAKVKIIIIGQNQQTNNNNESRKKRMFSMPIDNLMNKYLSLKNIHMRIDKYRNFSSFLSLSLYPLFSISLSGSYVTMNLNVEHVLFVRFVCHFFGAQNIFYLFEDASPSYNMQTQIWAKHKMAKRSWKRAEVGLEI